jgi:HCOMODA/2-hydroxy-3-carboxy-muconic semialdehyde decarboxylase
MNLRERSIRQLVAANRILANEGVLDAYGHVSLRNPENPATYFLSCSRSPENVVVDDIVEYGLNAEPVDGSTQSPYMERFIHAAIFEARPDIHAVVHSHAEAVLPFTIMPIPLRPVFHVASDMGAHIPRWDSQERFGDTNILVTSIEQGRDLALRLGNDRVVLMRGHGFSAAGRSLIEVVKMSVYLPSNARVLMDALRLVGPNDISYVTPGEIEIRSRLAPDHSAMRRAWDHWCKRAGVDPD